MSKLATISTDSGALVLQQATSDDHLIEIWLKTKESEKTREAYTAAVKRLRRWLGRQGCRELGLVTMDLLQRYQEEMPSRWSGSTRNLHKAAIKSLWTLGAEIGYFPFDVPAACYHLGDPSPVSPERILSHYEMMQAIELEPNDRHRLILRFTYSTGARINEVLNIRWRDLNRVNGEPIVHLPICKRNKPRNVHCGNKVYEDVLAGKTLLDRPNCLVFYEEYRTVYDWVKASFRRIGKKEASPHWIRHAAVLRYLALGWDWHAIARQLGHKSASFTMDRYGHFVGINPDSLNDC